MFYMPKYHNLPDGRQVFLRFPDAQRHGLPVSQLLKAVPAGEQAKEFLAQANADPQRLVLVAEIAGEVAGCGLLELNDSPRMEVAVCEAFDGIGLDQLMQEALTGVAAQKGVAL